MTSHVVLLGDSIFDNRKYTGGAPDVVGHLRKVLPSPCRATLCAVDGSTTADLAKQLPGAPADASHLVVSIGGNDAILNSDLLDLPVKSTADALALFGDRLRRFESSYRCAIEGVLALKRQTAVCTIYNGNLDVADAPPARVVLMMFNDAILRLAIERQLAIIDLRLVCSNPQDYANPIEPSGAGGRKIALAIAGWAVAGTASYARVYGGVPGVTG
jgi:GDSL-like Lipase/Acylhydrolase family